MRRVAPLDMSEHFRHHYAAEMPAPNESARSIRSTPQSTELKSNWVHTSITRNTDWLVMNKNKSDNDILDLQYKEAVLLTPIIWHSAMLQTTTHSYCVSSSFHHDLVLANHKKFSTGNNLQFSQKKANGIVFLPAFSLATCLKKSVFST